MTSRQEKAKPSKTRWVGAEVPHLLLTSALTPVMSESEAAAEMGDPGEKSCLSELLSGLHFCSSPRSQLLGSLKAAVADWLGFSHLASDAAAKCFRGPLGDLHCAKTPFLFLPPAPSLTSHSAPSEGASREPVRKARALISHKAVSFSLSTWARGHWVRRSGDDLSPGAHMSLSLKSSSLSRTRKEVWSLLSAELSESCRPPPCSNGFCLERTR